MICYTYFCHFHSIEKKRKTKLFVSWSCMFTNILNIGITRYVTIIWGWLGEAKVSCIYRHRGVQLILAYSWARPAIIVAGMIVGYNWARPAIPVAGKGRGVRVLFLLFLHFHSFFFLPCPSFSSPLLFLLSLFSLSLGDDTK